jgi:tRNA threonylcarbamoyladenosine biosynthesis protein TsaE
MTVLDELRQGVLTRSAQETRELAARLASELPPDTTLALHGDLGVGKTTFVQGIAAGLGVEGPVTSPTFTLCNMHRGKRGLLAHLDAYRLESPGQLDSLLLDDFLQSPWWLAIEWPERVASRLAEDALHIELAIAADGTAEPAHRIRLAS